MPENTKYVGRGSKFGNPYKVDENHSADWCVEKYRKYIVGRESEVVRELSGFDLACWCPLDSPCHADVLLEICSRYEPPLRCSVPS